MPTRARAKPRASSKIKKKKTTTSKKLHHKKAEIGRWDSELKKCIFKDGSTVADLLKTAGLELTDGEAINDLTGKNIKPNDIVKNGETYLIVRNYKSLI